MKKFLIIGLVVAVCSIFLAGCGKGGGYNLPTKTGGGGKQQTYIPAGNKGSGGRYMHVNSK